MTSVRLVTNPEKNGAARNTTCLCILFLHGLTVDSIVVNRVLPAAVVDTWFNDWHLSQDQVLR